jgi:hypothetical protein
VSDPTDHSTPELRETYSDIVPPLSPPDVFDPVIEAYKKDVDRTLIRENLKLTHEQRLQKLQSFVNFLTEMRRANSINTRRS